MAIIYGINPVMEQLLAEPDRIESISLLKGPLKGQLGRIARQARDLRIKLTYIDRKTLNRLAESQNHQGVIATTSEYKYTHFDSLLPTLTTGSRLIILDGIQDPQNLGAIVRTAVCAAVQGIIIPSRNAASMTAAAIKTSAGASAEAKIAKVGNLANILEKLKQNNIWTIAVEADGEKTITDLDPSQSYAFVFGSEGQGIRRLVREKCDMSLRINMPGKFDSLNVSVAVGIVLFGSLKK